MQSMDGEPVPPSILTIKNAVRCGAMYRLGAVLDDALARSPESLSAALRSNPIRAELQAILIQLDPTRLLAVLNRLAMVDLPARREVLEALLAADPSGSGQALRATLQALHRQELLARIFQLDRVQALRRACAPPAQELA